MRKKIGQTKNFIQNLTPKGKREIMLEYIKNKQFRDLLKNTGFDYLFGTYFYIKV